MACTSRLHFLRNSSNKIILCIFGLVLIFLFSSIFISSVYSIPFISKKEEVEILVDKPQGWGDYIISKGYVALNGVSLTVGRVTDDFFSVYLIPETIRSTNLLSVEAGTKLNLEVDQNLKLEN